MEILRAIVEDGVVTNMVIVDNEASQIGISAPEHVGIGWLYDGEIFTRPSVHIKRYTELRAAEYPPMSDYLDGIVKGDTAQVQAYIDACLAVKAKYPSS